MLSLSLSLSPSVQSWGSMKEGQGSPDVQVFLGSVEHFISHLSSARLNMENLFQLQPPEQQDLLEAVDQLSSPADYNDAGRVHWSQDRKSVV